MEVDSGEARPNTVAGELISFNKVTAFFRFQQPGADNNDHVCLFRPNKLYVEGQKLGASHFKSVATISNFLNIGDVVSAIIEPHQDAKTYFLEDIKQEVVPRWYAQYVWKGKQPSEVENYLKNGSTAETEIIIEDVEGKIVHNKLAINGKGGANQTFISFTNPEGKQDLAMFRSPRYFYIDGERARADLIKRWPVNQVKIFMLLSEKYFIVILTRNWT